MTTRIVHDLSGGKVEIIELTPEEIDQRAQEVAAYEAAQETEAAKPTAYKELLAKAEQAKTVDDLKLIVQELIARVYGISSPLVAAADAAVSEIAAEVKP